MRARLAACLCFAALLSACEAPPMLQIVNAGPEAMSVGVEWHSKTVQPGLAYSAPYSGRDFSIIEGSCHYKYRGSKPGPGRTLKLRWLGSGRLEGAAQTSRQCAG